MPNTQTSAWDVVDHLKSKAEIEEYRVAVIEDGDPELIAAAMGDIARAWQRLPRGERT